ncbi:MAG: hypothetical protein JXA13_15685 [Anaerolineales bacterium]|nr:hypothetical protein [Anaerolineales bacterium]
MENHQIKNFLFAVLFLLFCTHSCSALPLDWQVDSGGVLFQDNFSNPSSGWQRASTVGGILDYDGGGFRFMVTAPDFNFWSVPGLNLQNVIVDVDVGRLAGPIENRMGLLCRYRDEGNYYFFAISSDGYYGVGKVVNGTLSLVGQAEMNYTPAINQGMTANHLHAECVGNQLIFYINEKPVALVTDFDLAEGDVGLLAGTFDETGVDVIFDNFIVTKP